MAKAQSGKGKKNREHTLRKGATQRRKTNTLKRRSSEARMVVPF